jgi:hypothetical protein
LPFYASFCKSGEGTSALMQETPIAKVSIQADSQVVIILRG